MFIDSLQGNLEKRAVSLKQILGLEAPKAVQGTKHYILRALGALGGGTVGGAAGSLAGGGVGALTGHDLGIARWLVDSTKTEPWWAAPGAVGGIRGGLGAWNLHDAGLLPAIANKSFAERFRASMGGGVEGSYLGALGGGVAGERLVNALINRGLTRKAALDIARARKGLAVGGGLAALLGGGAAAAHHAATS